MVRKRALGGGLLFLILITLSFVSAYNTDITIDTLADHNVSIRVLENPNTDSEGGNLIELFEENSGSDGQVKVTCSSADSLIYVVVMLSKDGKSVRVDDKPYHRFPVDPEKFHSAGIPIYMNIVPGQTVTDTTEETEEVNETETNETETGVEETEQTEGTLITGQAVSTEETESEGGLNFDNLPISKIIYIALAIIVISLLIVFLIKVVMSKRGPEKIKIRKYSDMIGGGGKKDDDKDEGRDDEKEDEADDELSKAERKLKEAEEEIQRIKERRKRISTAEGRFKEARQELEKLRNED